MVIGLSPFIKKYGIYYVIQGLLYLKLGFSIFGYIFGNYNEFNWKFWAFFLLFNKVFNEAICRHGNLVLTDLVDEDCVIENRKQPISAAIFGINALFTKPGFLFFLNI